MIKRRFYRYEHGDKDAPSESSSSSDSEVEAESTDESEYEEEEDDGEEEANAVAVRENKDASSSSGYESEDSSVNEVNLDSSGLPSDDDSAGQNGLHNIVGDLSNGEGNNIHPAIQDSPKRDEIPLDETNCVVKCKSVFRCRLCPRIVCLSEETLKAHLNSKRHARSQKLLKEGRLKLMLNDEGKIEGEAHLDKDATTTVEEQETVKTKKEGKGHWKSKKRARQERRPEKGGKFMKNRDKKRKNDS